MDAWPLGRIARHCARIARQNCAAYRTGIRVTFAILSSTIFVSGCLSHSFFEHQHWNDVRTGES